MKQMQQYMAEDAGWIYFTFLLMNNLDQMWSSQLTIFLNFCVLIVIMLFRIGRVHVLFILMVHQKETLE